MLRHVIGMALDSDIPNLPDAGSPVGPENQGEYPGNSTIELAAIVRISQLAAIGTGRGETEVPRRAAGPEQI